MRLGFRKRWLLIPLIVIAIVSLLMLASCIVTVPSGYIGIKMRWGKIVGTAGAGLHINNPFLGEGIDLVNLQIQAFESEPQSTASNDLQSVTTRVTVNYKIDGGFVEEVYRDLRNEYESRIIRPQLEDALKATTAKFTSTEMIQSRQLVRTTLLNLLKERLEPYHIIVVSVSMTDFQFSPEFDAQLEATATAQKKVLEEQANLEIVTLQQQQKVIIAEAEANATITKAEAEALATIIHAEAESEAIRLIREQLNMTLSDAYLTYYALLNWDGKLPYYYGSDTPLPFLVIQP